MKWILFLVLMIPLEANASAEETDLRLMMHSSTAQEMRKNLQQRRQVPRLRALCAAQLRKKYVPEACFEVRSLTRPTSIRFEKAERWLIDNCVQAIAAVQDLRVLRRLVKTTAMPEACRSEAQRHYDDLRYAAETESPATLFEAGPAESAMTR